MPTRDYYEVLGVPRDASRSAIQSAYRRLAREHHPDVNSGDREAEERFKEINEAYRVLSDDEQRARYDRFGIAGDDMGGMTVEDPFTGLGDIFEMFFGGGGRARGRRSSAQAGEPVEIDLQITLKEALTGVRKDLSFSRLTTCDTCNGSGARPGSSPVGCPHCGGLGQVNEQRRTLFGTTVISTPCYACRGEGMVIQDPCPTCRGAGRIKKTVKQSVEIPRGVENGATLQVSGGGHDGIKGGPPGDMFINVSVAADKRLQRRGTELYTVLETSFAQLALGDTVTVEGVDGPVEVEIMPGSQPGSEITVRGKGMPALGQEGRGDLHVGLRLTVPTDLTERQKELLVEFERESGRQPSRRKKGKSFLDQFKDTLRGEG
ncbi:MAG: molecular chaperone DnaJ [Fimbriimonadia bacterium]|jgi:molecular chaperone DnaJ